jgi:hypothetical protein
MYNVRTSGLKYAAGQFILYGPLTDLLFIVEDFWDFKGISSLA